MTDIRSPLLWFGTYTFVGLAAAIAYGIHEHHGGLIIMASSLLLFSIWMYITTSRSLTSYERTAEPCIDAIAPVFAALESDGDRIVVTYTRRGTRWEGRTEIYKEYL